MIIKSLNSGQYREIPFREDIVLLIKRIVSYSFILPSKNEIKEAYNVHFSIFKITCTVTNEGRARAHDPGSAIVHVRMNLDSGTFAPQIIRSA